MEGPQADQPHTCGQVTCLSPKLLPPVLNGHQCCVSLSLGWGEELTHSVCESTLARLGENVVTFNTSFHFYSMLIICCEFLKLRNLWETYSGFPFLARMGNLCWNWYSFVICPLLLPLPVPVHHSALSPLFFLSGLSCKTLCSRSQLNEKSLPAISSDWT